MYSKPAGTTAVPNTTVESAKYNSFADDLVADANAARPITAGGTGATSASGATTALKAVSYGSAQSLTSGEKTQARTNIDVPVGASNVLPSSETDLNNYTSTGFYLTPDTGLTNLPTGFSSTRYHLMVIGGSSYVTQLLYNVTTGAWAKRQYSGSWASWLRYADGTYTPTVSATTGTITSSTPTGRYTLIGDTCFFEINVLISTNGTGAGYLRVSAPFTAAADAVVYGMETGTTDKAVVGIVTSGSAVLNCKFYDGTYPGANNYRVRLQGYIKV